MNEIMLMAFSDEFEKLAAATAEDRRETMKDVLKGTAAGLGAGAAGTAGGLGLGRSALKRFIAAEGADGASKKLLRSAVRRSQAGTALLLGSAIAAPATAAYVGSRSARKRRAQRA